MNMQTGPENAGNIINLAGVGKNVASNQMGDADGSVVELNGESFGVL